MQMRCCECSFLRLLFLFITNRPHQAWQPFALQIWVKAFWPPLLLSCMSVRLHVALIQLSWSQLSPMLSAEPQTLPETLMGLSSLISATCWNRKLAKHWKDVVRNLHQSLNFKHCQLLAGVTGRAQTEESTSVNFLQKHKRGSREKPNSSERIHF